MFKKGDKAEAKPESKSWYQDKFQYVLVQRNILAITTLVALILALISVFAVMQLTPYKSVEPFVIQVDEKSGIVQRVDPVTKQQFTANEAIENYFIVKYITARETYDISDLRHNYNIVRVMSNQSVYADFRRQATPKNPNSPAAVLQTSGKRTVKFKSITYIDTTAPGQQQRANAPQVAQVRVQVTDNLPKVPAPVVSHQVITLQFQFSDLNLTQEDRYINPLGFTVLSYRKDRDAMP